MQMSSIWGKNIRISIFGESHGAGIGVVIDGLPAGERIDMEEILFQMSRRAPGRNNLSTPRKESDQPEIYSGFLENVTTGAPLCAIIKNNNTHSSDYQNLNQTPRPGHADYTGRIRYNGFNDYRGGGHFSGRLTAPMVFAGAVCRQILFRRGIEIGAHIYSIAEICDKPFDTAAVDSNVLNNIVRNEFPVLNQEAGERMCALIETARTQGDSVGGVIECAALGFPCGIGSPIFDGVENRLAGILFGIPAVKGIEFGAGFESSKLRGSENNDPFYFSGDNVRTKTNRCGGILGGISTGMPLVFRLAVKPTPSIFQSQETVDLDTGRDTRLTIKGRHDPCIVIRALPAVEALTAVCLLDMLEEC